MQINKYFSPFFNWWLMILLSTGIAAIASYYVTRPLQPIYSTRATLIVGRVISDLNPNSTEFNLARQLADAYASIANREPIRNATMKALNLPVLPDYTARLVPNSPWVEITVTDTNPARAQAVAEELAHQLILQSPTNSGEQVEMERIKFVNDQLDALQQDILKTKKDIADKQQTLAGLNSAAQIADTRADITALETKLNLLQSNYATLLASTQQGATNTLSIFESASLPTQPVGPNKPLIILVASACGFIFATGAAYLIEFLDRGLKTAEQIKDALGVPVIGIIGNIGKEGWTYVSQTPRSPTAESFRTLRANLELSGKDQALKTILVASIEAGDGKSTISTNLACIYAQSLGKRVLLLDCDLRIPKIHLALGIPDTPGITEALLHGKTLEEITQHNEGLHLDVIPAGMPPPNPVELLSSDRMKTLLAEMSERYDIIIIDGPPLLVTDCLVLSQNVSGVLLVFRYGRTNEKSARIEVEQLRRSAIRILGAVLNYVPRQSVDAKRYYSNRYYNTKPKK